MFDGQLDLFPGKRISPYLGYSRDWGKGTGVTDFVGTGNEYAVADVLRDKTDNYRGGVRLEFNRFHLTLEQGGTAFKDDQNLFAGPGTNFGNRTTKYLGQTARVEQPDPGLRRPREQHLQQGAVHG